MSIKNIYFICSGLSTNDIIDSINNIKIKKEKKNIFNIFSFKDSKNNNRKKLILKKNELSRLDKIGIKELYLCQENEENKKIFNLTSSAYTSLDFESIESSFILFNRKLKNTFKIFPLPYTTNDSNIKDITTFNNFKKKFGKYEYINDTLNQTYVNKYWNSKLNILNLKDMFFDNIKKFSTKIDWLYTGKNITPLNTYSYKNFKILFEKICIKNKNNDIIFIGKNNILLDIFKEFKKDKFNRNKHYIEYTSIWKINVLVNVNKNSITYIDYNKIYPNEFNYKPLEHSISNNNDLFYHYVNNIKYQLFNSLKYIPLHYLKIIEFQYQFYQKNKQNVIAKILNIDINSNKKIEKNNKPKNNKPKINTYESLTNFYSQNPIN